MAALLDKQTLVATHPGLEGRDLTGSAITSIEQWPLEVFTRSNDHKKFVAAANVVTYPKTIGWSVAKPKISAASLGGAATSTGTVKLLINATQVDERRIQGYSQNMQTQPGWEDVGQVIGQNANASPTFGEGFTCATTDEIQITVTPTSALPTLWRASIFGRESSTNKIVMVDFYTAATTANQEILRYDPSADFTFLSYTVSAIQVGSVNGFHVTTMDGLFLGDILGWCNHPDRLTQPFAEATYGAGAIFINTWGMKMFEGQSIGFSIAKPEEDESEWHQFVMGTTTAIAVGGSGGSYTFAG